MVPYDNMQRANAIVNVYSETSIYSPEFVFFQNPTSTSMSQYMHQSLPHITNVGNTVNIQDFSPQQIQQLISHFNVQAHIQVQEPVIASTSTATLSETSFMANATSSGTVSFSSTSLKYENNNLTF